MASGELQDSKPSLVSSDGRVVDGHHTWAAHVLGGSQGTRTGTAPGQPVIRVDLPADKLIAEARRFAREQGIGNRELGVAADPRFAKQYRGVAGQAAPKDTLEK